MKKINFMSVFSAKFAVTALAVVGLALTSCEKEDFSVNVPPIVIPDVDLGEGVTNLIVSAASSNGNKLDVDFTCEGTKFDKEQKFEYGFEGKTFTVTASKPGYVSVTKDIYVPAPQKHSYSTITVEFVLDVLSSDHSYDAPTQAQVDQSTLVEGVPENTVITSGDMLKEGPHTMNVYVPTGAKYTPEQISALYEAVNKLEGPTTRALDAEGQVNLAKAQEMLRTQIANLRTEWNTVVTPLTYTVKGGNASSLTLQVVTTSGLADVTLGVTVADEEYKINGKATVACESKLKVIDVTGEDISHSHGHGHGDGTNDGGGTAGK